VGISNLCPNPNNSALEPEQKRFSWQHPLDWQQFNSRCNRFTLFFVAMGLQVFYADLILNGEPEKFMKTVTI
jgi:hypothetical protein